jgi:hypothetical protein
MQNLLVVPNLYQAHSKRLHVSYTTSGIDAKPHFHYQDAIQAVDFTGDQIRTDSSEIGTLVSVQIRVTPDNGSTSFSILIPKINIRKGESARIQTIGITTVHRSSLFPPLNAGQTDLYSVAALSGTAQEVEF